MQKGEQGEINNDRNKQRSNDKNNQRTNVYIRGKTKASGLLLFPALRNELRDVPFSAGLGCLDQLATQHTGSPASFTFSQHLLLVAFATHSCPLALLSSVCIRGVLRGELFK